jgi:hypothetical protein
MYDLVDTMTRMIDTCDDVSPPFLGIHCQNITDGLLSHRISTRHRNPEHVVGVEPSIDKG